ncbi:MAG: hypothetical protein K2O18_11720 [Oscillospiraceae bacterium]|nr:hypothetical protein [Oscillospiraceae bacterium]
MTYRELKETFCDLKQKSPKDNLTAHVIFTEDSFAEPYPLLSRTYHVSSDNKAFWSQFSNSIFAYCLDVTSDQGVRLDWYMADEGNKGGWKVEECYILEHMQDADAIPSLTRTKQDDGSVCYFFGDTCIQACEIRENCKIRLEALTGKQTSGGEGAALAIDRVYGYCTLLTRYLNEMGGNKH